MGKFPYHFSHITFTPHKMTQEPSLIALMMQGPRGQFCPNLWS